MSSTPFRSVNFVGGQIIDEDTMNQLANNEQYLRDNTVDGLYQFAGGGGRTEGIKILAGKKVVPQSGNDRDTITVYFDKFFTPNSSPIVVCTAVTEQKPKVDVTVSGIGSLHPDHNGFQAKIVLDMGDDGGKLNAPVWVNWQAIGY